MRAACRRRPRPYAVAAPPRGATWIFRGRPTDRSRSRRYSANLARALQLKREHGYLTPDQERVLSAKFEELRETISLTEGILAEVIARRVKAANNAKRRADERLNAPGAFCDAGCACCPTSAGG